MLQALLLVWLCKPKQICMFWECLQMLMIGYSNWNYSDCSKNVSKNSYCENTIAYLLLMCGVKNDPKTPKTVFLHITKKFEGQKII